MVGWGYGPHRQEQPHQSKIERLDVHGDGVHRDFPDDTTCLEYLWRQNHATDGHTATCPKCETRRRFHRVASRPSYSCDTCGHHIHPTANTIFHKSSTSLALWFYAIFLMSQTRCGISAKQLEREIGVTYKTAWRMFHLIRNELMSQDDDPMSGQVEMDETYIGGKPRVGQVKTPQDRGRWVDCKAKVFGMVERGGQVAAHVIPATNAKTIMPYVTERVLPASIVYTDEATHYTRSIPNAGYQHRRIHHKARVYVKGDIHTQTIEGFWSLVKRGISGTHHAVSAKHLQGYLDEYTWRYNHRNDRRPMFFTLLDRTVAA